MTRALTRKARGPGSSPVQDRIFLFQFYKEPTDGLVLKTTFSIISPVSADELVRLNDNF